MRSPGGTADGRQVLAPSIAAPFGITRFPAGPLVYPPFSFRFVFRPPKEIPVKVRARDLLPGDYLVNVYATVHACNPTGMVVLEGDAPIKYQPDALVEIIREDPR